MLGRSREEQNQRDLAALREEVGQLGADLKELASTLHSLGARNLGPAAERLQDAVADAGRKAGRRLRGAIPPTSATPQRMAGIAFAAGLIIGFLLRPGSSEREDAP